MATVLARSDFRLLGVLRSLVLLPLVLPAGGRRAGTPLHLRPARVARASRSTLLGIQIAFSTIAVVMAQTFVAIPFLVVSLEGALRTAGVRYEVAAASSGRQSHDGASAASPSRSCSQVSISGAVLAFARSLGEFGATITFAGSLQGRHPHTAPGDLPPTRDRPGRSRRPRARPPRRRRHGDRPRSTRARWLAVSVEISAYIPERRVDVDLRVARGRNAGSPGPQRGPGSPPCWPSSRVCFGRRAHGSCWATTC